MIFDIIEDGQLINKDFIKKYSLNLKDYSIVKEDVKCEFVGFVIGESSTLASFPKKYYSAKGFPRFSNNVIKNEMINIRLLLDTMIKYYTNESSLAVEYYGNRPYYISNFPFASFFVIFSYFRKYGLYKKDDKTNVLNGNGKINWKKTINSCEFLISNDNVIYREYYNIADSCEYDIVTKCMIDILNQSYSKLSWLIDGLKPIKTNKKFKKNNNVIIPILKKELNIVFSDEKKNLINAIIDFYSLNKEGGDIYLKIYCFENCWQKMVNKYLNDYFKGMTEDELLFNDILNKNGLHFDKRKFYVDEAHNHYIEPDHYSFEANKHYIFDSKYYMDLVELNYKQLSYQFLLSNFFGTSDSNPECFSVLFLPGDSPIDLNYNIKKDYSGKYELKTIEYYLSISIVMISYVYNRKKFNV